MRPTGRSSGRWLARVLACCVAGVVGLLSWVGVRLLLSIRVARVALWLIIAATLLGAAIPHAAGAETTRLESGGLGFSPTPSTTEPYAVCPQAAPGRDECMAIAVPPAAAGSNLRSAAPSGRPFGPSGRWRGPQSRGSAPPRPGRGGFSPEGLSFEGSGELEGWTPEDLRSAYRLPATGGSEQTVAIVDAFNDPNAESDLKTYRSHYGLSECTTANGCFKKVNQKGEAGSYPENEPGWSGEISLDLDMVSAVCPGCHILLVEATNETKSNLGIAENEAATLKATEISNSWGSPEVSGETSEDTYFNHPAIPITAAAGDSGYDTCGKSTGTICYPAASKDVISVGGTTLYRTPFYERGWFDEAWVGTVSGCSAYEAKPSWQTDVGCKNRTDNDVAAVASEDSPVSVYDSYEASGWQLFAGTSVSSPIVAGVEALSSASVRSEGAATFYKHPESLFDVTTGFNWPGVRAEVCSPEYLCVAKAGYDGPTGNGTPDIAGGGKGLLGRWSAAPDPGLNGAAREVSCVSASWCLAVGEEGEAEIWNGTEWSTTTPMALMPGDLEPDLVSVACTSSSSCTAVGGHSRNIAIEHWNGSAWSTQLSPEPTGLLGSVACASEKTCVAIGESGGHPLAEVSEGASWARRNVGLTGQLGGVTCTSSTACIAVGRKFDSGPDETLVERWNGEQWTVQISPNPGGAESSELVNVSCTSANACTAVGSYKAKGENRHNEPLIERWEGANWMLQTVADPHGSIETQLRDVSCGSSTSCTAVGMYDTPSAQVPLIEHWTATGKEWQATEPGSKSDYSELSGVSCTAAAACQAVGFYALVGDFPYEGSEIENLGYSLNPATERWSLTPMLPASSSTAVSCASSTSCTAVTDAAGESSATSEIWNGAVWSNLPVPPPSGEVTAFGLSGTSCTKPGFCAAVGSYVNGTGTRQSLAEFLEPGGSGSEYRSHWAVESSQNPEGAKSTSLTAVSCSSSRFCTAVGRYTNAAGTEVALAERTSIGWEFQEVKTPTGAKWSRLLGVSCTSLEVCAAVGTYANSANEVVPLAERWEDQKWSIQSTPSPTGAKASSLTAVSCASATACTAVGHYTNSSGVEVTLAEQWNGTNWFVAFTPTGGEATAASALQSVSCQSTSACTAVGSYKSGSTVKTLVEFWTGSSWLVQSTPNPSGPSESVLRGVSCTASPLCMAVGFSGANASSSTNLSEVLWGPQQADEWRLSGAVLTEPAAAGWKGNVKVGPPNATVECTEAAEGSEGPGAAGVVTQVGWSNCKSSLGLCTEPVTMKALNLPWHTEVINVEGSRRLVLVGGGNGSPGFKYTCGNSFLDECTAGTLSLTATNTTGGVTASFIASEKPRCTDGVGTPVLEGTQTIEATKGGKLEVVTAAEAAKLFEAEWRLSGAVLTEPAAAGWKGNVKVGPPNATVECTEAAEGSEGPGAAGVVTQVGWSNCKSSLGLCTEPVTMKALNLPWHTEVINVEGSRRLVLVSGGNGSPGFKYTCGNSFLDECTAGTLSLTATNTTGGVTASFIASEKPRCTDGVGTPVLEGTQTIEATKGGKLEVML